MKIGVVGIGAMGCLLGAYLGDISDVTLIGHWPEQIDTIRAQGLWLEQPDSSLSHHFPRITGDVADIGPADVALVVVKSRQTSGAAHLIAEFLKPEGLAVTLQNGLNNCATLQSVLGKERVALGVTSQGATVQGVARVRHAGHGPTYFGREPTLGPGRESLLAGIVALFNTAGFESYLVDNTDGLVWGKLAINAAINPLTALLRVPNGFLVEHEALVDIMVQAAREVAAVAEAQGIVLPFPDAAERALAVANGTATNRSSMLQDVERGALTEVEAICGAVARLGRDHNVPTPMNMRLCRLVRQVEGGQPPLLERGDVAGLLRLLHNGSNS